MPEPLTDPEAVRELLAAERRGRALAAREAPEPGDVWRLELAAGPDAQALAAAARWARRFGAGVETRFGSGNQLSILRGGAASLVADIPDDRAAWAASLAQSRPFVRPADAASPVLSGAACRDVDRRAWELCGIPGLCLMENAAVDAVILARDLLARAGGSRVLVAAGGGNNGGDGLAAARGLAGLGVETEVILFKNPEKLSGDAGVNLRLLRDFPEIRVRPPPRPDELRRLAAGRDLVIDALLGTGFRGSLAPAYGEAVEAVNASQAPVLALDAPSGLDADSGEAAGPVVRAERCLAFAALKPGLLRGLGGERAGRLYLGEIGVPPEAFG